MLNINFALLALDRGGKPGGQKVFEDLIVDLVGVLHPTARSIQANPGDWGIDVIVGELGRRKRADVWQAKFFIDGCGKSQRAQIRSAYDQAVVKANEKGYRLASWTLCIPVAMDAETARWWDNWKRRKRDGVAIDLWQENQLRAMLLADDNRAIFEGYFATDAAPSNRSLETPAPEEEAQLESALFVAQLRDAGLDDGSILRVAKHAFFNAELVALDVGNRGVPMEREALLQVKRENLSVWAADYGAARQAHEGPRLPGLHRDVIKDLRELHPTTQNRLRLHFVHRDGVMHQLVDDGEAGWTSNYEQVAHDHDR